MTLLFLAVESAIIETDRPIEGLAPVDRWHLELRCVLKRGDTLEFTTGERAGVLGNPDEIEFSVAFKRRRKERTAWLAEHHKIPEGAAGTAHAGRGNEHRGACVYFEVFTDEHQANELLAFARHGRFPDRLTIDVDGEGLRGEHINRSIWDLDRGALLPMRECNFSMPISTKREAVEPLGLVPLRRIIRLLQWGLLGLLGIAMLLLVRGH